MPHQFFMKFRGPAAHPNRGEKAGTDGADVGQALPPGCATQKWQIARIPFLWHVFECLDTLSVRRPPLMPNSLPELEAERSKILRQLTALGDLNHRPSGPLGPRSLHRMQPPFHMPVV